MMWFRLYWRRWGALGAVLVGAGLALYRMTPAVRLHLAQLALAWLAMHWLTVLPWALALLFFVLWRRARHGKARTAR